MGLLTRAADYFKARQTRVDGWFEDANGRYAFAVTVDGQPFVVCAKKYLRGGDAAFMAKKVVQRAIDRDALLLLFVDGQRLVFDPHGVERWGDRRTESDERRRRGEDWLDIDTRHAVDFEDWYDHRELPDHPDTTKPTGVTGWEDMDPDGSGGD